MQTLKWVHLFEMHLYLPCLNGCLDVESQHLFLIRSLREQVVCRNFWLSSTTNINFKAKREYQTSVLGSHCPVKMFGFVPHLCPRTPTKP